MEADRADGSDGAGSEYKVLEAVKMVRTCQNSLGQNGTRLGLLLLLVGPNGDGFGGQEFMEHYNVIIMTQSNIILLTKKRNVGRRHCVVRLGDVEFLL
jgi:hypothetical protein